MAINATFLATLAIFVMLLPIGLNKVHAADDDEDCSIGPYISDLVACQGDIDSPTIGVECCTGLKTLKGKASDDCVCTLIKEDGPAINLSVGDAIHIITGCLGKAAVPYCLS